LRLLLDYIIQFQPFVAFFERCLWEYSREKKLKTESNNLFPCFSPRLSGISFIYPLNWTTGELNWCLLKKSFLACSEIISNGMFIHLNQISGYNIEIYNTQMPYPSFQIFTDVCRMQTISNDKIHTRPEVCHAFRLTCQFFFRTTA